MIEKIENSDLESNQAFIDVQQKIEGLNAQYYLRIQSGKYVSGFGLGVEGGRSDFIVHSDSFALGNPAGGDEGVSYPFIFRNTPFTDPVTGTVFPVSAYLKSAIMDYQSVKTSHIEDLAVKTAQIDNAAITTAKIDSLAVTTAKIANLAVDTAQIASAAITTAKIGDLQVDTLKIKDDAVSIGVGAQGVHTLSAVSNGGKMRLDVGIQSDPNLTLTGVATVYVRVLRNGIVIRVFTFPGLPVGGDESFTYYKFPYVCALPPIIESFASGTSVTYSIQVATIYQSNAYVSPDNGGAWLKTPSISMAITELKK